MTAAPWVRRLNVVLLVLAAGCGGETLLGSDMAGQNDGSTGNDAGAQDADARAALDVEGVFDVHPLPDGRGADGGAARDADPEHATMDQERDALIAAICDHVAQSACWEAGLEGTSACGHGVLRTSSSIPATPTQCHAAWVDWAQCLCR